MRGAISVVRAFGVAKKALEPAGECALIKLSALSQADSGRCIEYFFGPFN